MEKITKELDKLAKVDRNLLDLTKYDAVNNSYQDYLKTLDQEIDDANEISQNSFNYAGLVVASVSMLTSILGYVSLKKKITL